MTDSRIWQACSTLGAGLLLAATLVVASPVHAQAPAQKPNIVFIMGDDIGWMQPSIYHRGLMVGETPNIDRIGNEGAIFMDYPRHAELHLRAQCLLHRHVSAAHRHDPAAIARQSVVSAAGHPGLAKFLHDLGYTTGEFGKNHLGDHTEALPTAHGFQEYWGWLYHLDAMQQVSFPDINSSPTVQGIAPPCKNTPVPGLAEVPGAVDPMTTTCLTPPRPLLWCTSSDGTEANQTCNDRGPADAGAVEDGGRRDLGQGRSTSSTATTRRRPASRSSVWYNPARMHVTTVLSPKVCRP